MNYGEVISEAFRLAWRNRFLWFFGFFVAGGSGLFNFPSNFGGNPTGNTDISSNGIIKVVLSIGLGRAYFTAFLILGLVLVGPAMALFFAGYTTAGIVVGGLLFLVMIVVISGAVGTFSHAYWTLAYLRLVAPNEEAAP